jgi:hypothetical protein
MFEQEVVTYEYFGMQDVVAELGGISASLKVVMSAIGIAFIF